MNKKQFEEDVAFVRRIVLEAIPTSEECGRQINYDTIIKALSQVIAMMIDELQEWDQ